MKQRQVWMKERALPEKYNVDVVRRALVDRGFVVTQQISPARVVMTHTVRPEAYLLTTYQMRDPETREALNWREELGRWPVLTAPGAPWSGAAIGEYTIRSLDYKIESAADDLKQKAAYLQRQMERIIWELERSTSQDAGSNGHINSLGEIQGAGLSLDIACVKLTTLCDQREELVDFVVMSKLGPNCTLEDYTAEVEKFEPPKRKEE